MRRRNVAKSGSARLRCDIFACGHDGLGQREVARTSRVVQSGKGARSRIFRTRIRRWFLRETLKRDVE